MLNIFSLIFSQPRLSLGFVFFFFSPVHPLDIIPAEYEEKKVINVIYIAAHSGELDLTCAPHPSSSSATAPCILHRLCVCVCEYVLTRQQQQPLLLLLHTNISGMRPNLFVKQKENIYTQHTDVKVPRPNGVWIDGDPFALSSERWQTIRLHIVRYSSNME